MFLLRQGGLVMWPLLFLSICSCVIIIERWIFYSSMRPFKKLDIEKKTFAMSIAFEKKYSCKDKEIFFHNLCDLLPKNSLFNDFSKAISFYNKSEMQENLLQNSGQGIVEKLSNRLELIAMIAKIAPLLGLLGTVIGMIDTFSRLENIQGGIDMEILAGGIWQALLTTAVGLVIAIPAWIAFQLFTKYRDSIAAHLERIAGTAMAAHFSLHKNVMKSEGEKQ